MGRNTEDFESRQLRLYAVAKDQFQAIGQFPASRNGLNGAGNAWVGVGFLHAEQQCASVRVRKRDALGKQRVLRAVGNPVPSLDPRIGVLSSGRQGFFEFETFAFGHLGDDEFVNVIDGDFIGGFRKYFRHQRVPSGRWVPSALHDRLANKRAFRVSRRAERIRILRGLQFPEPRIE